MEHKTNHRRRPILYTPAILATAGPSRWQAADHRVPRPHHPPRHRRRRTQADRAGAGGGQLRRGLAGSRPRRTDGAANQSYMNSIFGELFELGTGGKLIDDLATGYSYTNGGKTVVITLRKGVTFSDGTPFNAAAVVWNWNRDLAGTCTCKPVFLAKPVVTQTGPYTLSLTLPYVDAPSSTASRTTFSTGSPRRPPSRRWVRRRSPSSRSAPGRSPSSATPRARSWCSKKPHYWEKGKPYLNTLTFKPVWAESRPTRRCWPTPARSTRACPRRSWSRRSRHTSR